MKQVKDQPESGPSGEQAKPERADHKAQDSLPSSTVPKPQRVAPPRRPLFGR